MSYIAPPILNFSMPMVRVAGIYGPWAAPLAATGTGSVAWPTANRATFLPFRVPAGVIVKRLWVAVGATGGTDTWDLGLYTDGGVQIVHKGSTTAGTANTVQFMDTTDTYLAPGAYYMGMSSSGTTATVMRYAPTAPMSPLLGGLIQLTAHPLPATASFATETGGVLVAFPVMGYCTTATP